MTPLIDCLRAFLGGISLAEELPLLTAADARAAKVLREHGVLYCGAVRSAIDDLAPPGPCASEQVRAAYYLGLQTGWRTAQRFR
jgi:hypothetical protein